MIDPVFQGIVGHEPILKLLTHASHAPASAYLFSGPDHAGKRLVAERFTRLLLKVSLTEPLDAHPDFIRVVREEGAKELTVKQARELLQRTQLTSARGGRIVALVEQADRWNEEANNALLKTLEEPPQHVTYLFVAEQPERLPATVRSRMIEIRFDRLRIITGDAGGEASARVADTSDVSSTGGVPQAAGPVIPNPKRLLEVLRSAPLGLQCQLLDQIAKEMESSEDPSDAWREFLQALMRESSSLFSEDGATGARIGFGLIHAWHLTQTTLSPRLALEWQALQPYISDDLTIPSFLKPSYL